MKPFILCASAAIVFLHAFHAFGQTSAPPSSPEPAEPAAVGVEPLAPKEVIEALHVPMIQQSYLECIKGKEHPVDLKLVVIINEDGSLVLESTLPLLDGVTSACFKQVTAMAKVRATGQKFKMITALPPPAPPVAVPAPPSEGVEKPPYVAPHLSPEDEIRWSSEYSAGTGMLVSGLVLTGLGGVAVAYSLIFSLVRAGTCDLDGDDNCIGFNPTLLGVSIAGVVGLTAGMGLFSVGVKKRNIANALKQGLHSYMPMAREYATGTTMLVCGTVLTGLGGITTIGAIIYALGIATTCYDGNGGSSDCGQFNPDMLGISIAGVIGLGIGTTLLGIGIKKRAAAKAAKRSMMASVPFWTITPVLTGKDYALSLVLQY